MLSPWQWVFLSFVYQGKVMGKKPVSCFYLRLILFLSGPICALWCDWPGKCIQSWPHQSWWCSSILWWYVVYWSSWSCWWCEKCVHVQYYYAIIVAVLKWAFVCDQRIVVADSCLLGFVDNWFLLSRASCLTPVSRWAFLKDSFRSLVLPCTMSRGAVMVLWMLLNGTGIFMRVVFSCVWLLMYCDTQKCSHAAIFDFECLLVEENRSGAQ